MKWIICVLLLLGLGVQTVDAQRLRSYRPSMFGVRDQFNWSVSFAQSAVSDYRSGEKQNLEITTSFDFTQAINLSLIDLVLKGRSRLGISQETTEETEWVLPTDNDLFLENVIVLPFGWKADPYFAASLQTAITESFRVRRSFISGDYLERTANLWDPVTTRQGLGFWFRDRGDYGTFGTRIGVSLSQVRSKVHTRSTDDFKTRDVVESYKAETGIEFINEADINLEKDINYRATFSLYSTFDEFEVWEMDWSNQFRAQIWRFIGVTFNVDFTYNDRSDDLQFRQSLTLGVVQQL